VAPQIHVCKQVLSLSLQNGTRFGDAIFDFSTVRNNLVVHLSWSWSDPCTRFDFDRVPSDDSKEVSRHRADNTKQTKRARK